MYDRPETTELNEAMRSRNRQGRLMRPINPDCTRERGLLIQVIPVRLQEIAQPKMIIPAQLPTQNFTN